MKTIDRKAAIAAYKERKPAVGIYLIRCRASGQCWIGASPTLDTIRNRHWFTLRHGSFPHPGLQTAWRAHGAESFGFEILEHLAEDEEDASYRGLLLKKRLAHWQAALQATPI